MGDQPHINELARMMRGMHASEVLLAMRYAGHDVSAEKPLKSGAMRAFVKYDPPAVKARKLRPLKSRWFDVDKLRREHAKLLAKEAKRRGND